MGVLEAVTKSVHDHPPDPLEQTKLQQFLCVPVELQLLSQQTREIAKKCVCVEITQTSPVLVNGHFGAFVGERVELVLLVETLEHGESRGKLDVFADGARDNCVDITEHKVKAHDSQDHDESGQ